jgi:hypothetical protein
MEIKSHNEQPNSFVLVLIALCQEIAEENMPDLLDLKGKSGLSIAKLRKMFEDLVKDLSEEDCNNFTLEDKNLVAQVVASCISEAHVRTYYFEDDEVENELGQIFKAVFESFTNNTFELFDEICKYAENFEPHQEPVFVLGNNGLKIVVLNPKTPKKRIQLNISYSK